MAALDAHGELAIHAFEETGRGVFEDKATKNLFACEHVVKQHAPHQNSWKRWVDGYPRINAHDDSQRSPIIKIMRNGICVNRHRDNLFRDSLFHLAVKPMSSIPVGKRKQPLE